MQGVITNTPFLLQLQLVIMITMAERHAQKKLQAVMISERSFSSARVRESRQAKTFFKPPPTLHKKHLSGMLSEAKQGHSLKGELQDSQRALAILEPGARGQGQDHLLKDISRGDAEQVSKRDTG